MSTSSFALQTEAIPLQRLVKTQINDDLKRILKAEGLPVAGVKAQLQDRILTRLSEYVNATNVQAFNKLRYRIHNPRITADPPSSYLNTGTHPSHNHSPTSPVHVSGSHSYVNGYRHSAGQPAAMRRTQLFPARVHFKESPFYEIEGNVTPTTELTKSEAYRQTQQIRLEANPAMFEGSKRIMLFCAADPVGGGIRSDIAFPHHMDIKVNSKELNAKFRGLKNKPGSTRPPDITDMLHQSQSNYITVTYVQTQRIFYIMAVLVRKRTVEELVERIKRGRMITKQSVLAEMRNKAADPDIEAISTKMSLKDPVSATRIEVPCRSTVCTHNQCLDAKSFLQLQEQAPTWTCPICNKVVDFGSLAVDEYVQEILQFTSKSTEQVTIEPNGAWSLITQNNDRNHDSRRRSSMNSEDDIVEITDHRITNIKNEMGTTPLPLFGRTPPASSREASTPTSAQAPQAGNKRKSAVIDLTLSSDEDEPVRPPKRYQPYSVPDAQPNSYRGPNNVLPSPTVNATSGFQTFQIPKPPSSNGVTLPSHHSQNHPSMRGHMHNHSHSHGHYGGYIGYGSSSSPPGS